jgi:Uroporphyrinogen decarboxylase (URO-D)
VNSKERLAFAMGHKMPDRVPVMCQLSLGHYFLNMKDRWKPHEIFFTSEAFADSLVTLCRRYHFDGILINIPGRDPQWMDQVRSIKDGEEGEAITWKDNTQTVIPWDDSPQYGPDDSFPNQYPDFASFDPDSDIDQLDRWSRYTWGIYHTPHVPGKPNGLLVEPPDYFFRTIDLVKAAVGDSASVHGEVFSPFTHFMELFNYEQALMGLVTDSAKVEAILDRLTDATIAWGKAQARRGVDAILISSAFAGGGFISPRMYRRFVVPFERRVADALHGGFPGIPVYTHTCGMLNDRLDLLVESNVDGIDTLDPPPLGNTNLADAKRQIGYRLFIKGNMNSVAILTDSEEQFIERATNTLMTGKPGGGYILSTACSVAPHVEPWKLELLVDVAEEHGQYQRA